MQSYKIVIEYTDALEVNGHPETWGWWELLDLGPHEALSVVSVEEIEMPEAHKEELAQDALDELAEIAQKHNMGY